MSELFLIISFSALKINRIPHERNILSFQITFICNSSCTILFYDYNGKKVLNRYEKNIKKESKI